MPTFAYDPLDRDPDRPSIRLAVLALGRRDDPIKITLIHDSFANKPKYECISYTWGSTSAAKGIEINGTFVSVRRNLEKALRHFRRKDEDRMLWIDAICINQADDAEKSWQVTLMADIYRRAQRVLVWLGIIDAIEHPRPKRSPRGVGSLLSHGKAPERESRTQEEKDREEEEYHRALCQKPYWQRVWIVQEVGAAADLELHWDLRPRGSKKLAGKSESWDRFFDERRSVGALSNRATELARQRVGRHGDAFLLANLIEAGADALCELPHDKIYGFVAIAHDCEDGSFPVDYSKSLWKVYEDFVKFQYSSAKDVAAKSIVHFSQVVLQVLKDVNAPSWMGLMSPGCGETCYGHICRENTRTGQLVKITSMFAGDVSILGPSYDDLTGNPGLRRDWNLKLRECDADPSRLREESETFISKILALDASELRKAAANIHSFGWRFLNDGTSRMSRICCPDSVPLEPGFGESGLRLFATTEGTIGLIPSYVRKEDMLYRFWNSEVVAVVRTEGNDAWRIVGKGLLAKQDHIDDLDFDLVDLENVSGLYLDTVALYHLTR